MSSDSTGTVDNVPLCHQILQEFRRISCIDIEAALLASFGKYAAAINDMACGSPTIRGFQAYPDWEQHLPPGITATGETQTGSSLFCRTKVQQIISGITICECKYNTITRGNYDGRRCLRGQEINTRAGCDYERRR